MGTRPKDVSSGILTIEAADHRGISILTGSKFIKSLEQIAAKKDRAVSGRRRYAVSSLFLHESFRKLTADRDEELCFITGNEIDGVLGLDQWAEFAHQKRSVVGVTAATRSTHKVLIKLDQFGHRLLSHPGSGPDSTNPSGIDENFQRRLESAGHVAVMAIFGRTGSFGSCDWTRTSTLKSMDRE